MTQRKEKEKASGSKEANKARSKANLVMWKPGQSGNPNGRPPLPVDVREALEAGSGKAARRLVELIDSEDGRIALAAIDILQNRLYGRPVQAVDAKVETTNVTEVHLKALELIEQRRAERMKTIEAVPEIREDQESSDQ